MSEILKENQPVKFTARNHRPFYKRLRAGDFYGGNFEYDQETWEALKTIPYTAMIEVILYWHDRDSPQPEAKPEKPIKAKGEHGAFWHRLFADGAKRDAQFFNHPDFHTALNLTAPVTTEQAKSALHEEFSVESLTFVSPETFVDWCVKHELHAIATIASRLASEVAR